MITIREMNMNDYEAMYHLWSSTEGMGLSEADAPEQIDRYLKRNPGCCYVAVNTEISADHCIVGTLLAGHDGRRGYLYHMAVAAETRGQGIARQLITHSLKALHEQGIDKAHLFVMDTNADGKAFWAASGWEKRTALDVFSREIKSSFPE
jgi:N-acetylglutamate synthase